MDDDDFEFSDEAVEAFTQFFSAPSRPSFRRARWQDIPVLAFGLAHGVARAVTDTLMDAHNILAGHANFHVQQDDMREQAALEIETMIAGDENG